MESRPRVGPLAAIFLRIGSLTFGSGLTTTALLADELVERRKWIGAGQFALSFSLARITPGTNLLAFCTGAGWYIRGWPGAIAALLAVAVPSGLVVVTLTLAYEKWHTHPIGAAVISGAMSSILGVIVAGAWLLARPRLNRREWVRTLVLVVGAFGLATLGLSPLQTLAIAAVIAYFWQP